MASPVAVKKQKPMTKKLLDHFEKRLMDERKRVLKELGHYDETFGSHGSASVQSGCRACQCHKPGLSSRMRRS